MASLNHEEVEREKFDVDSLFFGFLICKPQLYVNCKYFASDNRDLNNIFELKVNFKSIHFKFIHLKSI